MGALVVLVALAHAIDTFAMIIAVDALASSTSPRQITLANTVHARAVVIAIVTRLTGYTFTVLASIALLAHTVAFSVISTMVGATQNAAVLALVFSLASTHAVSASAVVAAIIQACLLST